MIFQNFLKDRNYQKQNNKETKMNATVTIYQKRMRLCCLLEVKGATQLAAAFDLMLPPLCADAACNF
ncbi:MAG: hypothetical protein WEB53_12460 [Akkermansiaceae bacterium]